MTQKELDKCKAFKEMASQLISIEALAREKDVSRTAIVKAIESGRIAPNVIIHIDKQTYIIKSFCQHLKFKTTHQITNK